MANLDFYATRADHEALIGFLFKSTDVRIFESYSEYGSELREFRSFYQLAAAFDVGGDPDRDKFAVLLQLWSPLVESSLRIERLSLNPSLCRGHTFRYRIEGAGLIQLYLGGIFGRAVTHSHFGHFSEAGARKWGRSEGVNWPSLKTLSSRIQYHIRSRLAVARTPGRPVLAEAFDYAQSGYELRGSAGRPTPLRTPEAG